MAIGYATIVACAADIPHAAFPLKAPEPDGSLYGWNWQANGQARWKGSANEFCADLERGTRLRAAEQQTRGWVLLVVATAALAAGAVSTAVGGKEPTTATLAITAGAPVVSGGAALGANAFFRSSASASRTAGTAATLAAGAPEEEAALGCNAALHDWNNDRSDAAQAAAKVALERVKELQDALKKLNPQKGNATAPPSAPDTGSPGPGVDPMPR